MYPIIHHNQQSYNIETFIKLLKSRRIRTTGPSRPKFTIFYRIPTCFLLGIAPLVIKRPFFICTIHKIIVATMESKQAFCNTFFDPWVCKQVHKWIIYWFLESWIKLNESMSLENIQLLRYRKKHFDFWSCRQKVKPTTFELNLHTSSLTKLNSIVLLDVSFSVKFDVLCTNLRSTCQMKIGV